LPEDLGIAFEQGSRDSREGLVEERERRDRQKGGGRKEEEGEDQLAKVRWGARTRYRETV